MQNFINELENSSKDNLCHKGQEIPIIEKILNENNLTEGNKNSIIWKENDIIKNYFEKIASSNETIYFIKDNKKVYWLNNEVHYNNEVYTVLKVENGKIEEIEVNKKDMPKSISVNDVFRIENDKYVIDSPATKELQEEIINMAKEIVDKQNEKLDGYRKEGHIYMVSEELGNNRFLWDLTDAPNFEFEEVNVPKDLLDMATEGSVLKFTNGSYEYYSNDGFERAEKIHSSHIVRL